MLSCGEASGDLYAGALVRALHAIDPGIQIRGLGGTRFADAGGELLADYERLAVTGLTEAISKVPTFLATLRTMKQAAHAAPPDALVAIDSPDFNFPLARRLKRLHVPVVYYVGPQFWAWRPGRLKTIRDIADLVLVIFPFEEPLYREAGVPAQFVGHPLVDLVQPTDRSRFLERFGLSVSAPLVALLPGSRANEVKRILPDLLGAAMRIRARVPDVQFVLARAQGLADSHFEQVRSPSAVPVTVVEGETDAVLASADVVLTASGTATVQTALHDRPMVIVYRVSPLTYWLGRRLVTVDTFGMVNLIAGERIVPELIQDAFTPEAVTREVVPMLTDHARRDRICEGLARVRQKLGGPGASRRAAEAILELVARRKGLAMAPGEVQ
jgi:lipid-A-disaccharide synthase